MSFDPKIYRNSKDGIGGPGDAKATDSTSDWTLVALAKGLYSLLAAGITTTVSGVSTAALQTTGNASLTAIASSVDTVEALLAAATPAGTNLMGRTVADASAATGGIASTARLASAAGSTNATNVKTTAGRVYAVQGINKAAYDVFLVLYDSAANPPVPGTTIIRKKIPLAASAAFSHQWPVGLSFGTGIGYAFTKLAADADTTVLVAADILQFNLDYV